METKSRVPLQPGTIIDYCGERAKVIEDDGGERLDVEIDGTWQRWYWTFEGVDCTVVE